MTTNMLQKLAALSSLDQEMTAKMLQARDDMRKALKEAQEAVGRLTLGEVFALLHPEGERPQIARFDFEPSQDDWYRNGKVFKFELVRDARVPGFAVPIVRAIPSSSACYTHLLIRVFFHRYGIPVSEGNTSHPFDQVQYCLNVATVPFWIERTNNLLAYLEYYRCLLEAVRRAGVSQLYMPPKGLSDDWKHRMTRFAFEQVRAELGIDCVLVEKYDPRFCEYAEDGLVTRADAPILLQYLS